MRSDRPERCEMHLADGRRLAYTVTGPADGHPVLYCHGAIGTPVSGTVDMGELTARLGIRFIAPSRPGVGGSDPSPGRMILDFADDALSLAETLSLERFSVVGVSAGGPYALAIAHRLRNRVGRVAVVSSLSPLCAPHETPGLARRIRWALQLVARRPGLVEQIGDSLVGVVERNPRLLTRAMAAHAAPSERVRLAGAGEQAATISAFLDAACDGVGGMLADYGVYSSEWGFSADEVYNEVHLWHGLADPLVPVDHALQLAVAIPHCRLFFDLDEGHHFFRSSLERILGMLVGHTSASPGARVETTIDGIRRQAAARSSSSGGRSV
jgi:pimeloyl-ACP methyl ester carboxylesterase